MFSLLYNPLPMDRYIVVQSMGYQANILLSVPCAFFFYDVEYLVPAMLLHLL